MTTYLGIDVAKAKFDVALMINGKLVFKKFANTAAGCDELKAWLSKREVETGHACLEATGGYGDLVARFLHAAGWVVSVVNPMEIRGFSPGRLKRTKTDKQDAAVIARFCAAVNPAAWHPPATERRELQALSRRLESLRTMRLEEANRLEDPTVTAAVRASVTDHMTYLDEQIARTRATIDDHLDRHPDLKADHDLLRSIPGIGKTSATTLLAELPDLTTVTRARQVAAHAGLTPKHHQSGSSVKAKPHLSKIGNARLRRAVFFPALAAKRFNPTIKVFCDRLAANGKSKMVQVGAAMRKLVHIVFGVLKSRRPFDPNFGKTVEVIG
jgi:transposase